MPIALKPSLRIRAPAQTDRADLALPGLAPNAIASVICLETRC